MQMTTRTTLITLALDRDARPVFPQICSDLEETLSQSSAGSFRRSRVFDDFVRFSLDRLTVSVGFCDMERPGWPAPGHPDGAVALILALTTTHPLDLDQEATRNRQKLGQFLVRRIEEGQTCLDVQRTERSGGFDEDIYDAVLDSLHPPHTDFGDDFARQGLLAANSAPAFLQAMGAGSENAIILDAEVLPAAEAVPLPRRPRITSGAPPRKPRIELTRSRGTKRARPAAAQPVTPLRPKLNDTQGRRYGVAANSIFEAPETLADRLCAPDGQFIRQRPPDPEAQLRAGIREALAMPETPSIPIRLAAQTLNGAAMVLMPPIGGAMIVYASLGRANLIHSARALALSGTAVGLGHALMKAGPLLSLI
ncbi:hypothetical protein [Histidinibacterium lentulum]|uniref:Uncharacterized protein n=1 Tax=Histidinibacterium lentulum TaxID=2480588 RepID=A0A3N2R4G4_9RHOB|nr:hypothetical protein [Histidinibacterium lentulum]ROU02374.1 hypothetical protein EAT49_08500 [Histidinibacterium lentulum]